MNEANIIIFIGIILIPFIIFLQDIFIPEPPLKKRINNSPIHLDEEVTFIKGFDAIELLNPNNRISDTQEILLDGAGFYYYLNFYHVQIIIDAIHKANCRIHDCGITITFKESDLNTLLDNSIKIDGSGFTRIDIDLNLYKNTSEHTTITHEQLFKKENKNESRNTRINRS